MASKLPKPAPITSTSESPPPIGDNSKLFGIPSAELVRELLKDELASTLNGIKEQAEACKALTTDISDDAGCATASDAYKIFKGLRDDFEGRRVAAKEPWLAGSRAVDGYFVPVRDRIDEVLDALGGKVGDYLNAKEARARAEREAEARRLREEEEKRRREADEQRRIAEEAERRAQEARTKAARDKAAKEAEAARVNATVAEARADTTANLADRADESARSDKPADFARTRGEGSLSTLRAEWKFEIEDYQALDFNGPLRAFIKRDAIEKALTAFVKVNEDKTPLEGVKFFKTSKAAIR